MLTNGEIMYVNESDHCGYDDPTVEEIYEELIKLRLKLAEMERNLNGRKPVQSESENPD